MYNLIFVTKFTSFEVCMRAEAEGFFFFFFPFSAHSLFLDLTFLSELGRKKSKQRKLPEGIKKKGVAEHQFLRKTWSDLSPSSSPHEMIPSSFACDHILDPSPPQ